MPHLQSATQSSTPPSGRLIPVVKPSSGPPTPPLHLELARQLDGLPKELGVTLLVLGTFGVVIPGPIPPGFSFILLGVVALRPRLIEQSGAPLARRFPRVFRVLVGLVTQFRLDLARRYPDSLPRDIAIRPARRGR